jgi:hypothetical protein
MTTVAELVESGRKLGGLRIQALGMSTRLAAAIVLRQAYERRVDEFWREVAPAMEQANHRNQLVALRSYAGPEAARTAAYLWNVLSDACHFDGYELPPSSHEIDHLAAMILELDRNLAEATLSTDA